MVSLIPPKQALQAGFGISSAERHGGLKLPFLVPKSNIQSTLSSSGGRGKRLNINEKQRSIGQLNHPKAKQMQKDDSSLLFFWPILFLRISITNLSAWRWQEGLKLFHAELQLRWEKIYLFFLGRERVTVISSRWVPCHEQATAGSVGSCWASREFTLKPFAMPLKVRKMFSFINALVQEGG